MCLSELIYMNKFKMGARPGRYAWNSRQSDQLNTEDKSYITKLFEDKIAIIHLPPPKELSTKEKITTLAPFKVRRSQLKSVTIPNFNVMFTNANQLTSSKMSELITRIQREKHLITAICEIKPKNSKDRTMQDYNIPGYSIHPINLDTQTGRGMAVIPTAHWKNQSSKLSLMLASRKCASR